MGLERLQAKLRRLPDAAAAALKRTLESEVNELVAAQRRAAPVENGASDAGKLRDSIHAYIRVARKEQREAGANATNLAAGHLYTLSQQLMAERQVSESRSSRMQERADKLSNEVERLERDGQHREEQLQAAQCKLSEMSSDLSALYIHTAELEDAIRAAGIAAPQRPPGLTILPGRSAEP